VDFAKWLVLEEVRALRARLLRVQSFALYEGMLPAAALLPTAQSAIEVYLVAGRHRLRVLCDELEQWLLSPSGTAADAAEAQRRLTFLRLKFNAVLTQFDMFHNVITQRSETETGVWLSGLDVLSSDALAIRGDYYIAPPVICYLDRGIGAAIRRARTRLPGGGLSPVAVVRVPRERMVGSSVASSLIHEVGHQAASLLDLVNSLRPVLQQLQRGAAATREVWGLWERWISEIVADFWSVARVGVTSTLGLIGVISLPRVFVFRLNTDDPHPMPWIRVKLSCAIGRALFPHPQWDRLASVWESYYTLDGLANERRGLLSRLLETIPELVARIADHRPNALRGRSLAEVLELPLRTPERLGKLFSAWRDQPRQMYEAAPTLVMAALGQARLSGRISPEDEGALIARLLTHWALRATLDTSFACARADWTANAPQWRAGT
jgi:hypothetical protein